MASIILNDKRNGKEYKLEYNRNALIQMESWGFEPQSFKAKPLSSITYLSRGAFLKNHKDLSFEEVDEIVSQIDNIGDFVNVLGELYANAVNSIVAVEKSKETKNITWGKN